MLFQNHPVLSRLDAKAYAASRPENYGNAANWFLSFRLGLRATLSRLSGLSFHSGILLEWVPRTLDVDHEYHLAAVMFSMDSAVESFVFGLNALGYAVEPSGFRDIKSPGALRRIGPGDVTRPGSDRPQPGYAKLFPTLQQHFLKSEPLLKIVFDNHNLSKHRLYGLTGASVRNDAPAGYWASMGLDPSNPITVLVAPMSSILIPLEPLVPLDARPGDLSSFTDLATVIRDFHGFLDAAMLCAAADVESTIVLKEGSGSTNAT